MSSFDRSCYVSRPRRASNANHCVVTFLAPTRHNTKYSKTMSTKYSETKDTKYLKTTDTKYSQAADAKYMHIFHHLEVAWRQNCHRGHLPCESPSCFLAKFCGSRRELFGQMVVWRQTHLQFSSISTRQRHLRADHADVQLRLHSVAFH